MTEIKETVWTKELEPEIYESWKKSSSYKFDKSSEKPVYSIDTPPPYVNTPVHIGQATTYVLMDFFARFKRMTGFNVLFPLGLDRNGLPIEMAAEKRHKVRLADLSREEALEKCRGILEESSLASTESFLRLGISFNSWKLGTNIGEVYETDSEDYRALTQETFIELWNKKLIYEDERTNNFCPGCQTTIADAEVAYEELPSFFNEIKFKVKETGEDIIIATTRPELICACGMVIFNPEDTRYSHLRGKTAVTPLYNKEIPIMPDPAAIMDKGTGLMMMCSFGDVTDIRFFRDNKIEPIIAINKDGTMNGHAGILKGIKVRDAQKRIIEELKKHGLVVKQTRLKHRTPVCERSKDPIEFISMKEFYVKQVDQKEEMLNLADKMNFFDRSSKQLFTSWISSVSIDWPISRRRFYATEIPLWYCRGCSHVIVPEKGPYYQPWKTPPPIKQCPKCKGNEFVGETRVFDTWFDSSITPLYILKYSKNQDFFEKNSPCSLRPQGKEIVRTWLYYTVLKDYLLTKKCIFKDVWINYHIVDEHGYKMSKSKGNVIDPKEILDKFGAEPFRLWAAIEGNLTTTDFRCSFDRIQGAAKTLTKLWNIARFISLFPEAKGKIELTDLDKWILEEANALIAFSSERYADYDFHNPAVRLKHFIWETFSSHYLELVKKRAYNEGSIFKKEAQNAAVHTLNFCLDIVLKLLAPINPMITSKLYSALRKKDIHKEQFPKKHEQHKIPFTTDELTEINSSIWKLKKDNGKSLKDVVSHLALPEKFRSIEQDIMAAHNASRISYHSKFLIEL